MNLETIKEHKKAVAVGSSVVFLVLAGILVYVVTKDMTSDASEGQYVEGTLSQEEISLPEDDADIFGIISAISGNKVTILKLDPSSMPETGKMDNENMDSENADTAERPSRDNMTPPSGEMPEGMTSGEMPTGMGAGRGQRNAGGAGADNSLIEELKAQSTEAIEVTVPVGIAMYESAGRGSWNEITIADLTKNILVSIWLNDDITDRSVAKALQVGNSFGM